MKRLAWVSMTEHARSAVDSASMSACVLYVHLRGRGMAGNSLRKVASSDVRNKASL
jgi:hypothetical protein